MVTVESISESNVNDVVQLAEMLWPDTEFSGLEDHYSEFLGSAQGACFVLREGEIHIGFIEVSLRSDYVEGSSGSPVPFIEGIFVSAAYRRNGLGRLLMHKAEEWALANGFKEICSDTELGNQSSVRFHLAAGFSETSRNVYFVKQLG